MNNTDKLPYDPKRQIKEMFAAKQAVILEEISSLNNPEKEAKIHEIREQLSKFKKFGSCRSLYCNPLNDVDACRRDFIDLINRLISSGNDCVMNDKFHTLVRRNKTNPKKLSYRQQPYITSLGDNVRGEELLEFNLNYALRFINLWNEYRELLGRP